MDVSSLISLTYETLLYKEKGVEKAHVNFHILIILLERDAGGVKREIGESLLGLFNLFLNIELTNIL